MKTREFGRSGTRVGDIGLGCWQFGGDFGPIEDATAMSVMAAAVDQGVTFFDTADVYGAGRSESLIGRFLKASDAEIRVATKFGHAADVFPDGYSREVLQQGLHASLQRLGVDTLDLVQLHCVPAALLRDGEIFEWLREARDEGLIRHFGASVETVAEARICLQHDDLFSLQVIFNIFRQKLVTDLLPLAQQKGVGIIVRLPVASSLLTGKFTQQTTFDPSDHRHYNRDGQQFNVGETFAGLPFEKGVELVELLRDFVPEGLSMQQMALRWILDHDAVTTVIPGASTAAQAEANARVSDLEPLPASLHRQLTEFYTAHVYRYIRGPY